MRCTSSGHRGIDFATGCWSPIYAAASGTVIFASYTPDWGNYIKIDNGGGISGERDESDQRIGLVDGVLCDHVGHQK